MAENLCLMYLKETNQSLEDFEGMCLELCDEVMKWLDKKNIKYRLLSFAGEFDKWDWHTALEIDEELHDPWCDKILPLNEYLDYMFKGRVYVDMIDGVEVLGY